MATSKNTAAALKVIESTPRRADANERRLDAMEATWQIACLFDELAQLAMRIDNPDTLHECSALRAFATRGKQLSGFAMSALRENVGARDDQDYREVINAGAIAEAAHG